MEVVKPLHVAKLRRAQAAWLFDLQPQTLGLITLVLIALTSLLNLTQSSHVAATGYDITYAEDRRMRLQRDVEVLTIRAAELQALDRLEAEAINRLGMVPAPVPDYLPARGAPVDVEEALARAERAALHEPEGWRGRLAVWLRIDRRGDATQMAPAGSGTPRNPGTPSATDSPPAPPR